MTEILRHQLSNGLRVVLDPLPKLPLVAVNLWYHVGSKNERPGRTGLAHLFEHMLFQGSEHIEANGHFRYVQEVGGVANGSTWYDRTNYYETLPSSHLDLGLWLESDRLGFFLGGLDEEKLETQRSVVMNERRQRVDNQPYGRAGERLNELLYTGEHPYRWPVIGYMEDIEAATLQDVRTFFETFYTPRNAVLTLSGDFEPARALEQVQRFFADIPSGPAPPRPLVGLPPPPEPAEALRDHIELPRLYTSFVVSGFGQPDWFAARLLAGVLGSGKTSRLFRDLVYEREWAQSLGAYVLPTESCATLSIVVNARPAELPAQRLDEIETVIVEHLADIEAKGVTDAELRRVKRQAHIGHYSQLQELDSRADLLSAATTFFDDPAWAFEIPRRMDQVDSESVRRLIRSHLGPQRRAKLTVLPESPS